MAASRASRPAAPWLLLAAAALVVLPAARSRSAGVRTRSRSRGSRTHTHPTTGRIGPERPRERSGAHENTTRARSASHNHGNARSRRCSAACPDPGYRARQRPQAARLNVPHLSDSVRSRHRRRQQRPLRALRGLQVTFDTLRGGQPYLSGPVRRSRPPGWYLDTRFSAPPRVVRVAGSGSSYAAGRRRRAVLATVQAMSRAARRRQPADSRPAWIATSSARAGIRAGRRG